MDFKTRADRITFGFAALVFGGALASLLAVWLTYLTGRWAAWSWSDRVLMVLAFALAGPSIWAFWRARYRPALRTFIITVPIAVGTWPLTHDAQTVVLGLAMPQLFGFILRRKMREAWESADSQIIISGEAPERGIKTPRRSPPASGRP